MAIELITRRKSKAPLLIAISGILAVFLALGFLGSYIYFYIVNKDLADNIHKIRDQFSDLDQAIISKENEVLVFQKRIKDFSSLVSDHKNVENILDFIDQSTIPYFWFSGFSFEIKSPNLVSLQGETNSFFALEQQIAVFSRQEETKEAKLSEISIDKKEGNIQFSLNILFNEKIED